MPFLIVLGVILLLLIVCNIKIVSESNVYVVEFLGKYRRTLEAGIHVTVPFFERVAKKISLKEQVADFPPQNIITKDNVMVSIDTIVYYKVCDAKLYTYGVNNPVFAIESLTATTLRNITGDMELDDTLTSRDSINENMRKIVDEATDAWGIKVIRVELKNITPPREIQASMEKQMKAERERRETLLEAEGHKAAIVKREEGNKEARILEAEGKKQAAIAEAEGQAQAIKLAYEAQATGLKQLIDTVGQDGLMLIKKLEALEKVGDGRATKLIVPSDIANVASDLTLKGEFLGLPNITDIDKTPKPKHKEIKTDNCCEEIKDVPKKPDRPIPTMDVKRKTIENLKAATGKGFEECKNALEQTNYNFSQAKIILQNR